jgi:1-acyl-sn-glycerol-3-phosphate acyltransferase
MNIMLKISKIYNNMDPESFVFKIMPQFLLKMVKGYLRLEIEGLENLPKRGAGIITPNHSGFSGFDAVILANSIYTDLKRIPRVMTHRFWFLTKSTAIPAQKLGFTDANYQNGIELLKKNNLVILFPEGEQGNFKPTAKMYMLQEFKRGFVRMALETQSPIIPTLIIGAEETHINLSQLKLTRFLSGAIIPIPLNLIPLPIKWKIIFLPPIYLPYKPDAVEDSELVYEIAQDIQDQMQEALNKELKKRRLF